MHEGDHGILDETHNEFEAKFGNRKSHDNSHGKKGIGSEQIIKVISAVIIVFVIAAFLYFKFL
jgi:hypothetical protein